MIGRTITTEDRLRKALGDGLLHRRSRSAITPRFGSAGRPTSTSPRARPRIARRGAARGARARSCRCSCSAAAATCWSPTTASAAWWCATRIEEVEFDGTAAQVGCGARLPRVDRAVPRPSSSPASSSPPGFPARWAARSTATPAATARTSARSMIECTIATPDGARGRDASGRVVRVRVPRLAPQARAARAAHRLLQSARGEPRERSSR